MWISLLSFDNIIVTSCGEHVAGILDFGRVGFHPVELDFTRFAVLGPQALLYLIKAYESLTSVTVSAERVLLLRKARMLSGIAQQFAHVGLTPEVKLEVAQLQDLFTEKWRHLCL